MGIVIAYTSSNISGLDRKFDTLVPDVSYNFPATVLHTFLMIELSDEDKSRFFGTDSEIYRVEDLVWINSDSSKEAFQKYRDKYVESLDAELFENYKEFKGIDFDEKEIIFLSESGGNLKGYMNTGNYFYSYGTRDGKTMRVVFTTVSVSNSFTGRTPGGP